MQLKFYARGAHLVSYPRSQREGQRPRYIARSMEAPLSGEHAGAYPPAEDGFTCESATFVGRRLLRVMNRSHASGDLALWPADEATARACGVPFVATEFVSGEHIPCAPRPVAPSPRKG